MGTFTAIALVSNFKLLLIHRILVFGTNLMASCYNRDQSWLCVLLVSNNPLSIFSTADHLVIRRWDPRPLLLQRFNLNHSWGSNYIQPLQPLKLGNGWVVSSLNVLYVWLLIHVNKMVPHNMWSNILKLQSVLRRALNIVVGIFTPGTFCWQQANGIIQQQNITHRIRMETLVTSLFNNDLYRLHEA